MQNSESLWLLAGTALIHAVMNKPGEMFHYFSKSVETMENFALFIRGFPVMTKYRSDPRFNNLLGKMGLDN